MGNKKENRSRRRKDSIPDESIGKKATIIGMPEQSEKELLILWGFLSYILDTIFLEIMKMNLNKIHMIKFFLITLLFLSTYLFDVILVISIII